MSVAVSKSAKIILKVLGDQEPCEVIYQKLVYPG